MAAMEELKTDFWASALIRRAEIGGAFAGVVHKGDTDAGAVLVKVATLDRRARLYGPARNGEGERIWLDLSAGSLGDVESDVDDYVRGLKPGYAVSTEYSQDDTWDGTGTPPASTVEGFYVYDGGDVDGTEYWNTLEVMLRAGQVWVWWNGLLVAPSAALSNALATPVDIGTPYFPLATGRSHGKFGMRLWPGAKVRKVSVRTQPRVFSEFTYGQLELA